MSSADSGVDAKYVRVVENIYETSFAHDSPIATVENSMSKRIKSAADLNVKGLDDLPYKLHPNSIQQLHLSTALHMAHPKMSDRFRLACNSFSGIVQLVSPSNNLDILHEEVAKGVAAHYGASFLSLDYLDFKDQMGDDWATLSAPRENNFNSHIAEMTKQIAKQGIDGVQVVQMPLDMPQQSSPENPVEKNRFEEVMDSVSMAIKNAPPPEMTAENVMSPVRPTVIYFNGYQDIIHSEKRFRYLNSVISKLRKSGYSPLVVTGATAALPEADSSSSSPDSPQKAIMAMLDKVKPNYDENGAEDYMGVAHVCLFEPRDHQSQEIWRKQSEKDKKLYAVLSNHKLIAKVMKEAHVAHDESFAGISGLDEKIFDIDEIEQIVGWAVNHRQMSGRTVVRPNPKPTGNASTNSIKKTSRTSNAPNPRRTGSTSAKSLKKTSRMANGENRSSIDSASANSSNDKTSPLKNADNPEITDSARTLYDEFSFEALAADTEISVEELRRRDGHEKPIHRSTDLEEYIDTFIDMKEYILRKLDNHAQRPNVSAEEKEMVEKLTKAVTETKPLEGLFGIQDPEPLREDDSEPLSTDDEDEDPLPTDGTQKSNEKDIEDLDKQFLEMCQEAIDESKKDLPTRGRRRRRREESQLVCGPDDIQYAIDTWGASRDAALLTGMSSRLSNTRFANAHNSHDPFSSIKLDSIEKKFKANNLIPVGSLDVSFDSIGSLQYAKTVLKEIISLPLQRAELFEKGILRKAVSGVLLFGPPGTGKTMLAKAVAAESGANFLSFSMSDLMEMWVGQSEKHVKAVFTLARKVAPCVIFLDEVDSLFTSREQTGQSSVRREALNEFMQEWDGLKSHGGRVTVMAATNRPFDLDDAVIRRLPRRIMVDVPDADGRAKILNVILKDECLAEDVDQALLVKSTPGYTGSDLNNLCLAAAMRSVRDIVEEQERTGIRVHAQPIIHWRHFLAAQDDVKKSVDTDVESITKLHDWDSKWGEGGNKKASKPKMGFGGATSASSAGWK
eukprot:CFRG1569T1